MATNIRLKIKSIKGEIDKEITSSALVNAGYRSDVPEIIVPAKVAEVLGIRPHII